MILTKLYIFIKTRSILRSFKKNAILGKGFSVLHTAGIKVFKDRQGGVRIGDNVEVGCDICVDGGNVVIGNNTTIRHYSEINCTVGVTIGNDVIISNNCIIYDNNSHPTNPQKRIIMTQSGFYGDLWRCKYADSKPVIIEDNVWIGQRSMILKGVTIGKGSVVAANSVVTKDVPQYSLVAGNPAHIVKNISSV